MYIDTDIVSFALIDIFDADWFVAIQIELFSRISTEVYLQAVQTKLTIMTSPAEWTLISSSTSISNRTAKPDVVFSTATITLEVFVFVKVNTRNSNEVPATALILDCKQSNFLKWKIRHPCDLAGYPGNLYYSGRSEQPLVTDI